MKAVSTPSELLAYGRITEVNVVIDINGNPVMITILFEREHRTMQQMSVYSLSRFLGFMKNIDVCHSNDLIGKVFILHLSNEINPTIVSIESMFGNDAVLCAE